jgi:hypothetical protein
VRGMEFLVEFEINVPEGTPKSRSRRASGLRRSLQPS